jgi:hypothetical protein
MIWKFDEHVFQNPQILCRTYGLFPEQTTIEGASRGPGVALGSDQSR